jgi:hypothetical protein
LRLGVFASVSVLVVAVTGFKNNSFRFESTPYSENSVLAARPHLTLALKGNFYA